MVWSKRGRVVASSGNGRGGDARWRGGLVLLVLVVASGAGWYARGRGYRTKLVRAIVPPTVTVRAVRPAPGAVGVRPDAFVAADLVLANPGHGLDPATLIADHVRLTRASDGAAVPATVNTSGAGDAVVLVPTDLLEPATVYQFEVRPGGARDTAGSPVAGFASTFTTAEYEPGEPVPVAFEKVELPAGGRHVYTGLAVGPDRKLYAGTFTGEIVRHPILPDGTLGPAEPIPTLRAAHRGPRLITGLAFDPRATADDLVLWVSHGQLSVNERFEPDNAADWTGVISRLGGPDLGECRDVIVGLPRGVKDHLNNQPVFGPDGALYFSQGSNTAMGAPDAKWGFRPERLLTAAVLRLDVTKALAAARSPVDVRTEDGGTYDPFAAAAPLTIHATGVRVSFDLLWHSRGHLYAGVNGSAAGGRTPPTPVPLVPGPRVDRDRHGPYTGPRVPRLADAAVQPDLLLRVEPGRYYGHPNPTRNEFVLNGGNPTAAVDLLEVPQYPVGTAPDRNWHPPALDCGYNVSPNGLMEYTGGGWLNGKLLVTRYSGDDDVLAVELDPHGDVVATYDGIAGLTRFQDPLDLVQGPGGTVYVAEYSGQKLTLLRPIPGGVSPRVIRHEPPPVRGTK